MKHVITVVDCCKAYLPAAVHFLWHVVHPIVHSLGWDRWLGI